LLTFLKIIKGNIMNNIFKVVVCVGILLFSVLANSNVRKLAIFEFNGNDRPSSKTAEFIDELLSVELTLNSSIVLVEREEIKKVTDELSLSLSGLVSQTDMISAGGLLGANFLVTGKVFHIDDSTYIIAKVISVETGAVKSLKIKQSHNVDIDTMSSELSKKIISNITSIASGKNLGSVKKEEIKVNKDTFQGDKPSVTIRIKEVHMNSRVLDPAAETRIIQFGLKAGYEVLEWGAKGALKSDVIIKGEGFTETSSQRGGILSVRARLEVRAIERSSGKLLYMGHKSSVVLDVSPIVAGKKALENAASALEYELFESILGMDK